MNFILFISIKFFSMSFLKKKKNSEKSFTKHRKKKQGFVSVNVVGGNGILVRMK